MKLGRKFRELMRKRLGHGPPTIIKTSTNGKPYIARGIEADENSRRDFLKKAGSMAAVGGIGVLAGMAGLPVSATNTTNWNQGPGSMEIPADFVIFPSGSAWYRRDGDTGKIGDNSESDSPTTDPTAMILRIFAGITYNTSSQTFALTHIVVKGDYSSSLTMSFTVPVVYEHFGTYTYTGTADAIKFAIPQSSGGSVQGGVLSDSIATYLWRRILGPNTTSPYTTNANAIGVHVTILVRSKVEIGIMQYFAEGIRFDNSTANNVSGDNIWETKIFACNNGIHFFAGANNGIQQQGNRMHVTIGQCANAGVLIDSSGKFGFNTFTGTIDNAGAGGTDYTSNDTGIGNLLLFHFIRIQQCTFATVDQLFGQGNLGASPSHPFFDPGVHATGTGSAALGANCPAVTVGAPFTWVTIILKDGSTAYMPVWK